MKIAESFHSVDGNAVFDSNVKMSIEEGSMGHIMRSVTAMYADPWKAVAREYISNAYDATVERMGGESAFGAELDTPVEVALPTKLSPEFVVRDYGTGMTREVMEKVFPSYGASTKRQTNSQIGGFGLGAKSALAVVSSFTVASVRDGKKNIGIVQNGADGVGEISFLSEQQTEEPSGTTVTIPLTVDEVSDLREALKSEWLLAGFPMGSVLLDGKPHKESVTNPKRFMKVSESGWSAQLEDAHASRINWMGYQINILIGPIHYSLQAGRRNYDFTPDLPPIFETMLENNLLARSVLSLPIGSVDLTPSRDALILTAKTKEAITAAATKLVKELRELYFAAVEEAPHEEAIKLANEFRVLLDDSYIPFTYKGEPVPQPNKAMLSKVKGDKWISFGTKRGAPELMRNFSHWDEQTLIITGVKNHEEAHKLKSHIAAISKASDTIDIKLPFVTVYLQANKEDLPSWAEASFNGFFTVEEWVKKAAEIKKVNRNNKKEDVVSDKDTVSVLNPSFSNKAVTQKSIGEVAEKSSVVIYAQLGKKNRTTLSHKIAHSLGSSSKPEIPLNSVRKVADLLDSFYTEQGKKASVIRIPANMSVESLRKLIPNLISIDDAVKECNDKLGSDAELVYGLLGKSRSLSYRWAAQYGFDFSGIENETVRNFYEQISASSAVNHRRRSTYRQVLDMIETPALKKHFSTIANQFDALNIYPLPLMRNVLDEHKEADIIQYINLMYPAK